MKINEKIEEMRSKLIKKVMEVDSYNKEDAVQLLQAFGLDNESANQLLLAYRTAESAKKTAKNVWDTAWQSRSGVDFSTDIAKTQDREVKTRQYFDSINARCALKMVTNQIEPGEINDEMLAELYDQNIKEQDISNPALRITFHYYSESKSKDIRREQDLKKVQDYSSRIGSRMTNLENQLGEVKADNEALRKSNASLKRSYENLQKQFKDRIALDEKYYQAALAQIASLKEKLRQLQERGIFKTIGDKLFRNKRNELPEASDEIPATLYTTSSEKMGLRIPDENDMPIMNIEKETSARATPTSQRTSSNEWQQ